MIASKKEKEKWATSNYKLSTCYCWYNEGHVKKIIYVAFFFFNHLPNPTYNVNTLYQVHKQSSALICQTTYNATACTGWTLVLLNKYLCNCVNSIDVEEREESKRKRTTIIWDEKYNYSY